MAGNDSDSGFRNLDGGGRFQSVFSIIGDVANPSVEDDGGNQFGVDPLLGALGNNGGPTETHLPQNGSPAIDTGDPAIVDPPALDQAGNPRIVNGTIDLGAVEVQPAALVQKVPVPALGLFGLAAAALGIGGIGAAAARKRRSNGKAGALLLALAAAAGLNAPEASAADRGPATTRTVTTVSAVSNENQSVRLSLGNGQSITAATGTLEIKDSRRHVAQRIESANAIAAGQPVLIKVRYGRDGAVKRTVVRLFDSIEAAQREVAGK